MKKFYKIISLIICIIFFVSCYPDNFSLNKTDINMINGLNMSKPEIDGIHILAQNALIMDEEAIIAMRAPEVTQLFADLTCKVKAGQGFRFNFRTASNNFENHPRISFNYTTSGCVVKENQKVVVRVDSVKAILERESRIKIYNNGPIYNIIVDCDTVYYGRTKLPGTEYLIIESLPGSQGVLSGINFEEIYFPNRGFDY